MPTPPRILLGAERFRASGSGIGRVARLMARVLSAEARDGRLKAEGVSFSDTEAPADLALPVTACASSRIRYVSHAWRAAFRCSHNLFDSLNMSRAMGRFPARPALAWMHGVEVWEEASPKWIRSAGRMRLLLSNSAYTRDRAERVHGGFARAHVCWLATEEDEPPAPASGEPNRPTVLILSRLDEDGGYKGHRELIAAWKTVADSVPGARLVIAGDGPGRAALAACAAASPAGGSIEFKGFIPEAELPALWRSASVFAMPSRGEGFGLVYIEAMRHGLPVVASIHDAAPEINLDGVTGFNVDLNNPAELPGRLIHLLKNRDHARALGTAGQDHWKKHFRFACFRSRFSKILWSFLDGKDPPETVS